MSLYLTHAAYFSKSFLNLSVWLENAKEGHKHPLEEILLNVLLCKKKLDVTYSALVGKTAPISASITQENKVFETALLISHKKTQKLLSKLETIHLTNEKATGAYLSIAALSSLALKQGYLLFGGIESHPEIGCLSLDFPCKVEFAGITYPSALHAFIAQTFPNEYHLQEKCANVSKDDLLILALINGNHNAEWYNSNSDSPLIREKIIYHIMDAKFGQNPELRKKLLATLDATLIFTGDLNRKEGIWGAGDHGNRPNKLGQVLMQIRERYDGIGITCPSPTCYQELARTSFITQISALDKDDQTIEKEILELNNLASEEIYQKETTLCRRPENHSKNRFNDYNYVFNKTLVPLSTGQYINANFIHSKTVIASQTPMPNTSEDFWNMILDQKSKSVVMLNLPADFTHFFYCPDSKETPKHFGDIQVRLREEPSIITHPTWNQHPFEEEPHALKIRLLELKKGNETHYLTHYQYLNWRDLRIGSEGCMQRLIEEVNENQGNSTAPIVVHCLAGVGRTAAFAAIYDQYRKWKDGKEIDIRKCVEEQRSPQTGRYYKMVQSPEQYAFCYSSLRHLICNTKRKSE